MYAVERRVRYLHVTGTASRALPVELREYVSRTADAAVVLSHAATEPYPTVAGRLHQDDFIRRRTARVEVLPLTVLTGLGCIQPNKHTFRKAPVQVSLPRRRDATRRDATRRDATRRDSTRLDAMQFKWTQLGCSLDQLLDMRRLTTQLYMDAT